MLQVLSHVRRISVFEIEISFQHWNGPSKNSKTFLKEVKIVSIFHISNTYQTTQRGAFKGTRTPQHKLYNTRYFPLCTADASRMHARFSTLRMRDHMHKYSIVTCKHRTRQAWVHVHILQKACMRRHQQPPLVSTFSFRVAHQASAAAAITLNTPVLYSSIVRCLINTGQLGVSGVPNILLHCILTQPRAALDQSQFASCALHSCCA